MTNNLYHVQYLKTMWTNLHPLTHTRSKNYSSSCLSDSLHSINNWNADNDVTKPQSKQQYPLRHNYQRGDFQYVIILSIHKIKRYYTFVAIPFRFTDAYARIEAKLRCLFITVHEQSVLLFHLCFILNKVVKMSGNFLTIPGDDAIQRRSRVWLHNLTNALIECSDVVAKRGNRLTIFCQSIEVKC